jgi:hypothetical protein
MEDSGAIFCLPHMPQELIEHAAHSKNCESTLSQNQFNPVIVTSEGKVATYSHSVAPCSCSHGQHATPFYLLTLAAQILMAFKCNTAVQNSYPSSFH